MTPEDREKLIHGMRMLAQGRVNFVETVVDLLVPPQLETEEVLTMSVGELIAKLDKPAEAPTERGAPESPPEPKTVGSGSLKAKPGPKPKPKP